jgi:NAD(P)-dependent dehydrogenase (short-subunit alcohol dehydrogenase family)
MHVASFLVDRGARHLLLAGRSAPDEAARVALGALAAKGARVRVVQADVSRPEDVDRVLADAAPPLAGIVHAAGALDDGVVAQQTAARFHAVLAPKVQGAFLLDERTRDRELDFFVCFSSAASLLGGTGQASYAAANAFLDSLAVHRRSAGRPALSVNFGPWARSGMAARMSEPQRRRLAEEGWGDVEPEEGLQMLAALVAEGRPRAAVFRLGVARHLARLGSVPRFLERLAPQTEAPVADRPDDVGRRIGTLPAAERRDRLSEYVRLQVAKVLGTYSAASVDPGKGFWSMGMDSLLSLQLRNRLQSELNCRLPATLTMNYPNVNALVEHLGRTLDLFSSAPAAARPTSAPLRRVDVDRLSEDEAEALLIERLNRMEHE